MYRLRWYCCANLNGGRFGDLRTIYQGCRALPFALAGLSCGLSHKDAQDKDDWGLKEEKKKKKFYCAKQINTNIDNTNTIIVTKYSY